MHYAGAGGQADIMKVLLAEGADANLVDKVMEGSPICCNERLLPSPPPRLLCTLTSVAMRRRRMAALRSYTQRQPAIRNVCKCSSNTRE